MKSVYTHPDKLVFYSDPVPGSREICLPDDPSRWNEVSRIAATVAASPPISGPLDLPALNIFDLAHRYARRKKNT